MVTGIEAPPLPPLLRVVSALEGAGLVCALGGSGLLAAHGLAARVRDWDLTTDAALDRVLDALDAFEPEFKGPDELHTDHKLMIGGGEIEVIVGFAIGPNDAVVHFHTHVTGRWNGVPLGSPEVWGAAYAMMDRPERAALWFSWMEERGADPARVAALLEQPLPEELRVRYRALATSGAR
jgi:hypothetical protein